VPLTLANLAHLVHPGFTWAAHHRQIIDALQDVGRGKIKRLLISCPPQHAKSTLCRLFLSWLLVSDPTQQLMALSYSRRLATSHSLAVRNVVGRFGPALFGAAHASIRTDSKARDLWYTQQGGYVRADAAAGGLTGFPCSGCLYDDPVKNVDDATSEAMSESAWQNYSSVIETRLSPSGWVVVVATRWAPNDLTGRLLAAEPGRWQQLILPALSGPDDVPLWPERYPKDHYVQRRKEYEERGQSWLWESLYQCNPVLAGGKREWPAEWLDDRVLFSSLPEDDAVNLTLMAVDPSLGSSKGDYGAIVVARLTASRMLYVEADVQRRPVTTLEDDVVDTYLRVRPQALAIESNAFQQVFADNVRRKLLAKHKGIAVNLYAFPNTFGGGQTKPRIRISLTPLLAQGRIRIKDNPGGRLLREQLREYPGGAFDDACDALELATQLGNLLLTGSRRPEPMVLLA